MANLQVEIANIKLKNPVMVASGTFGSGKEYQSYVDLTGLGAIVTKSITLEPKEGNLPPRIVETPSGILNSIGLQNKGLANFLKEDLPYLRKYKTPVIVNIAGENQKEYVELARRLDSAIGVRGLEVNISCPNIRKGGMAFGVDPSLSSTLVKGVRKVTKLLLIVKLTPNVTDITEVAKAVESSGADAISLVNTFLGLALSTDTLKPKLGSIFGGLSGPAIKPLALRMVYQVANSVKLPVIGIGGISSAEDAIEFFLAGAKAIQIGTANFVDPQTPLKVINGLDKFLDTRGFKSISDIIGKAQT